MSFLLTHLLEEAAERFPDNLAIGFGETMLSYRELNNLAIELANMLADRGVVEGDRVGTYLDKSAHSIVSVHGILKAGAAYVPLDPKAPPRRLAYIIGNCGIRVLVTSSGRQDQVKSISADTDGLDSVILMDADADDCSHWPITAIRFPTHAKRNKTLRRIPKQIDTDLAYILYTSGSTGVPKGVMISHRNAMTFVNWSTAAFRTTHEDVLSNHAPLHFDLSVFDVFVAASAAAALKPVPDGLAFFPVRLAEWIQDESISIWYSVPSVLSALSLKGNLRRFNFSSLRIVLFAGEVFPTRQLRQVMQDFPDAEFFNLYGPTETNVVTYYHVPVLARDRTNTIPIGKACENTDVFLLNANSELVEEAGIEAELCVRGGCVANGYWADADKTEATFLLNDLRTPFEDRMYKTGDIVTLNDDGDYLFVGRKDHMIKTRGYRVELGEIEATLYRHAEIDEAVVIAKPNDEIGNEIIAFISLATGAEISESEIKFFCAQYLPRYMIPECIRFLDALPRTATGKVDRKSLAG